MQTRRAIVAAALELFRRRGYVATTIEAIAEAAGVAVSTVYYAFGSKLEILRAIREEWHSRSAIRVALEQTGSQAPLAVALATLAHATRLQWETGSDVTSVYRQAAAADAEAAAELESALAGRRAALNRFVAGLDLPRGTSANRDDAAAIVRALCRHELYEELVDGARWSPDKYEMWLVRVLTQSLSRLHDQTDAVS
jgi:AcrR family transcriptional regulator